MATKKEESHPKKVFKEVIPTSCSYCGSADFDHVAGLFGHPKATYWCKQCHRIFFPSNQGSGV